MLQWRANRFARARVPQPRGTRREFDYFREVSYGALDMTGSRVFGWLTMPHHTTKDLTTLNYPAGRSTLHDWGVETARAHGIDLRPFYGVAVYFNSQTDSGACGRHRVASSRIRPVRPAQLHQANLVVTPLRRPRNLKRFREQQQRTPLSESGALSSRPAIFADSCI
jgi:hypothetical protein